MDLSILALGGLDVFSGGVSLLVLTTSEWEEDDAFLEFLETLYIGLERLFGKILATWINGDSNGWCKFAWDSSRLLTG
jgi:hypothetical protein